jgi:hypothetical protein
MAKVLAIYRTSYKPLRVLYFKHLILWAEAVLLRASAKVLSAWLKRPPLGNTIWVKGDLNIGWLFTSTGTRQLA